MAAITAAVAVGEDLVLVAIDFVFRVGIELISVRLGAMTQEPREWWISNHQYGIFSKESIVWTNEYPAKTRIANNHNRRVQEKGRRGAEPQSKYNCVIYSPPVRKGSTSTILYM